MSSGLPAEKGFREEEQESQVKPISDQESQRKCQVLVLGIKKCNEKVIYFSFCWRDNVTQINEFLMIIQIEGQ